MFKIVPHNIFKCLKAVPLGDQARHVTAKENTDHGSFRFFWNGGEEEEFQRDFQRSSTHDHRIMIEYLIYKQYLLAPKAGQNFPNQRNSSYF